MRLKFICRKMDAHAQKTSTPQTIGFKGHQSSSIVMTSVVTEGLAACRRELEEGEDGMIIGTAAAAAAEGAVRTGMASALRACKNCELGNRRTSN
jgi:hypothetical protein